MRLRQLRRTVIVAVVAALLASGCSTDPASADSTTAREPDLTMADVVVSDATGDVAYSHGDHWHGSLRIARGETREYRLSFVRRTQASHDAPVAAERFTIAGRPAYTLHVTFEDATLVRWQGSTDVGTMTGQYPGGTRATFAVRFEGRLVFVPPPVALVVRE